jgi:hypothetical protein
MNANQLRLLAGNMTDQQCAKLVKMRGGCGCHFAPPCSACCEPLQEWEAQDLGLIPPQATSVAAGRV